jgi:hypothetical protein
VAKKWLFSSPQHSHSEAVLSAVRVGGMHLKLGATPVSVHAGDFSSFKRRLSFSEALVESCFHGVERMTELARLNWELAVGLLPPKKNKKRKNLESKTKICGALTAPSSAGLEI